MHVEGLEAFGQDHKKHFSSNQIAKLTLFDLSSAHARSLTLRCQRCKENGSKDFIKYCKCKKIAGQETKGMHITYKSILFEISLKRK